MNKKINELAVKAGVTFDWDPGTSGPEVYFDRQEDFEKFAELIVQECVWQVVKDNQVPQGTQILIGERIREHFGVEE